MSITAAIKNGFEWVNKLLITSCDPHARHTHFITPSFICEYTDPPGVHSGYYGIKLSPISVREYSALGGIASYRTLFTRPFFFKSF